MRKYPVNIKNSRNKSGYNGVYYEPATKKWGVSIQIKGKQKNIGRFWTKREAISAREKAEDLR
jgi:hypothetical protein